jgi:hypothetical protein
LAEGLQEFHLHTTGFETGQYHLCHSFENLLFCFRERSKTKQKMKRANEKILNTQINTQKWILTTIVEVEKGKTLST